MSTGSAPWWAVRYEAMASVSPAFAGEVDLFAETQVESMVEVLGLRQGERVLDIGCGAGRHSILLHERGVPTTGVDLSPQLLRRAGAAWEERNPGRTGPRFVPGDMRWLPVEGPFEAALYMDMALGVFEDDEQHLESLRSCRKALTRGGRVLIELFNPYFWARNDGVRHFPPGSLLDDGDLVRRYRFDALRGRVEDRVVVFRGGRRHEPPLQSIRAWTPPEIAALLHTAGFSRVEVFGSDGWEPPEAGSPLDAKGSAFMWVLGRVP